MKKITTILIVSAVLVLLACCIQSCKKNNTSQPQTTLQKIQNKWQLGTDVQNSHYAGADHMFTGTGSSADYIDFRTDGKVYSFVSGSRDTANYTVSGDTKITVTTTYSSDTYDIKSITESQFILYEKILLGGSDYDEETLTLKK